jgi:hypothetical protein
MAALFPSDIFGFGGGTGPGNAGFAGERSHSASITSGPLFFGGAASTFGAGAGAGAGAFLGAGIAGFLGTIGNLGKAIS